MLWGKERGRKGQERVGENINQCGMGVWLSGSALSARQIGKHFNGFLSTAPLTTLSGSMHTSHATMKNLTSICVHTPTERDTEGERIILPTPEYIIQSWHCL